MGCRVIGSSENIFEFQDFKGAAAYFEAEASMSEKIIVAPRWGIRPFGYYFRENDRIVPSKDKEEELLNTIRETNLKKNGRIWISLSTTQNSNIVLEQLTGYHTHPFEESTRERINAIQADGRIKIEKLRQFLRVVIFRISIKEAER